MDNPRLFYPWAATGQHAPSQHVAQPPPTLLQAAYYPTRNKRYKLVFFRFFFRLEIYYSFMTLYSSFQVPRQTTFRPAPVPQLSLGVEFSENITLEFKTN